ncbi:hypothetical protein J0X19_22275 [Hymenobacter sp. BT186]|uniref:Uncharacterized protein n=1 Tax=Hymenobacter telluris TaxID=2816474 RepID=A0A939EZG9_9BACT|nr:hypothetical protein [Hymenobacter telluris]MBO0360704.1 hypothetical protein [Hymenobacter telluris]MBW3376731.1 hypothetical protein [Hymenobacter norwichensis]
MSLTPVLEVAISLSLLYLFFSQVVSSIFEWFAGQLNLRGNYLRRSLNKALNSGQDKNWAELVYRHPSVDMLAQKSNRPPTYIPSSVFVKAIIDLVTDEARTHQFLPRLDANSQPTGDSEYQVMPPMAGGLPLSPLQQFKEGLNRVSEGDFKALMRTQLFNAEGCDKPMDETAVFNQLIHGTAVWYDNYMERVAGWYKRAIRKYLLLTGLLVAALFNLDSLRVSSYLWTHTAARQRIIAYAEEVARDTTARTVMRLTPIAPPADVQAARTTLRHYQHRVDSLTSALQELSFPIGWSLQLPLDSTTLPPVFLVKQAARTVMLPQLAKATSSTKPTAIQPAADAALPAPGATAQPTTQPGNPNVTNAAAGVATAATTGAASQLVPTLTTPAAERPSALGTTINTASTQAVPKSVSWQQPEHYVRYQRVSRDTTVNGLMLTRVFWQKSKLPIDSVANAPQLQKLVQTAPRNWWNSLKDGAQHLYQQFDRWTLLGWLLTAVALSFGAPFWFELLNRFVNMRSVGLRPPTATPTPDKEPS